MKRDPIDFHAVTQAHEALHTRLEDWAYWVKPAARPSVSPMFRLYRSDEHRDGTSAGRQIDTADCQRIERAVSALPRQHGEALRWAYVVRCSPIKAARVIACTLPELSRYVQDARQMLLNRRV